MKRRHLLRLLIVFVALLAVASAGFVIWAISTPPPEARALAALVSTAAVRVESNQWITFTPTAAAPVTGLVFYPGGRVDARAYAPLAYDLAEAGHLVVIVPMPLNLAVFNLNAADEVIRAHPEIAHWAVGGHSLGGAMAVRFVANHPTYGLVLLASYPDIDLSGFAELRVLSIYGTLDGLATLDVIEESRGRLPPTAELFALEGGNHAQFGWYGSQAGDNQASLAHEDQQAQTSALVAAFLADLSP